MKKLFFLLFLCSCSHVKTAKETNFEITEETILFHFQSSYLKGCVDAFQHLKIPKSFELCLEKAILHRQEIQYIMDQNP